MIIISESNWAYNYKQFDTTYIYVLLNVTNLTDEY